MVSNIRMRVVLASTVAAFVVSPLLAGAASAASVPSGADAASACTPGAHTLGTPGDHLYPDTGNGGYTSIHTTVNMIYNATTNLFLPGNNVTLAEQATQCLSSFSLDFEPKTADKVNGPNMKVDSVTVNKKPATFTFLQPTYPGDPVGQDDPNPAAHQASQFDPVGGPKHNPLPPACSPEIPSGGTPVDSLDGQPCPATKLVITPSSSIANGSTFTVVVNYEGRPGVRHDGDGSTEGWFRASDGGFVTTEPVGSEDWMPLNNFPTAKPTYDYYDTVAPGLTGIANGELVGSTTNPPNAQFPAGSVTWHWSSPNHTANYLVEDSVGDYTLTKHLGSDGILYYEVQDASIAPARQKVNLRVMNKQQDITDFESTFNGPYPFASDGIVIGTPPASFEEEMETMITFAGGFISTDLLYHENMHQWWGDNVTESAYNMTFFKEGLATLAQYLYKARLVEAAAGGPDTAAGKAAFQASLVAEFNQKYGRKGSSWAAAPSDPIPAALFSNAATYQRPGIAYVALRQILGAANFNGVLQQIQKTYGGGNIDEAQLEAAFHQGMPNQSAACSQRLDTFFAEWFDTAYPQGGHLDRPQITGPGLDGPDFYNSSGGCS